MAMINLNRRKFIQGAGAVLTLSALEVKGLSFRDAIKNFRVGLIGAGWYGKSDLFRLIQVRDVDVVAICDVDNNQLQEAGRLISERQISKKIPKLYKDYREMLANHKFDLILIGTPDHWHARQAIDAMRSGAHLYLQKPISVDVLEGDAIWRAARQYNRKVQVGTQRRSTAHLIDAKKRVIDSGLLGKISHVEMCCYYHMRKNGNPPIEPVPYFLDYELWTGPAPLRDYDGLPHGGWWRTFMAYGNGITGDMGMHMFDTVRWLLQLKWPKSVQAKGGIYVQKGGKSTIADTQTALFEYEDLNCIWQHRTWGTAADPEYPWAFVIYGDKGTLKGSVMKYEFIPIGEGKPIRQDVILEKEKFPQDLTEHRIELHTAPATRRHMLDLLSAIENNHLPVADIEEGYISTASCILANLSMQLNRPLIYDPIQKICVDDPEATQLLQRPYRSPWQHP
ncbi:MAG: Gfo/Idh/MocA family oxidoreductase [Sphingobacterium sp.]|jgi:predicted dehydrogenase|uniref:Gfo/Idh/MocA family protein n=1 Tax=Sphingobacterium sp. TaxID=341027 RepID=UPI00284AE4A4|nr:Gfo/Idh/MocA family oxidoreductase [Sphingobacterium sp.]MDR3006993.1 Gfo/Idh/MocA family oxidoreductase [Sphingobacterium sp.]